MDLNQIYNIDCSQYMQSLPDGCVNLVIADPPYGISKQKAFLGYSHGVIRGMDETIIITVEDKRTETTRIPCKNIATSGGSKHKTLVLNCITVHIRV